MSQNVAFIGLGIMGLPMAGHLLGAGNRVVVHTRTRAKADGLLAHGATWADSPADAARGADVVLVCVTDTPDVEKVLLGDAGVIHGARPGTIVVDHSTISPAATQSMAQELAKKQITLIDAPVSGGDVGARNATLSIMCGGDAAAYEKVRPLLEKMGKTITLCGPSGAGQITKLVNQVLVLGTLNAVCEAIRFAEKGGLDIAKTLAAVGAGAARSWQLEMLGPKIAAHDFAPGFMIDLATKDLRLVIEYAKQAGVNVPTMEKVLGDYNTLHGHGRSGTQALYLAQK